MKPIALLLLLSAGIQVVIGCGNGEIACNNSSKCIPYHYICDRDNDCTDASDEDPELCDIWRNTRCLMDYVECKRFGVTECGEISEFCSSEAPGCEGNLDKRVCLMLQSGRIDKLDNFNLLGEITENNLEKSKELAEKFQLVVPNSISHDRCPKMYTLVGDQCLSIFHKGHMSWAEAGAFCGVLDGDLLTIKNISHFAEIVRHLQRYELSSNFWIGGSIANTNVGWTWLDGSPMEMGSPFWATRYSPTCIQRNVTTAASETICDRYYQAPEKVMKGQCASLSYEHSFYMTDEDCLRTMSPLCIYQGRDLPTTSHYSPFPSSNALRSNVNWYHG
ncbi:uncharacterized protein [Palaemon carinicauda]|uniref:uncharacterized protein isoform X2 n=1 Tax=Palaemon carinicauda TaxID=392227 RepID=UPI0035B67AD8